MCSLILIVLLLFFPIFFIIFKTNYKINENIHSVKHPHSMPHFTSQTKRYGSQYSNNSFDKKKERYTEEDNPKEERIQFPFRAIAKEIPSEILHDPSLEQIRQRERIRDPSTHNVPMEYYQLKGSLQPLQQNINELYPSPYTPGERFTKQYVVSPYLSGTIGIRDTERPYQDITTEFIRVGTAYTEDQTDNLIMTLYRRDIAPERDLYEYKLVDKTNGNDIEIFLPLNTQFLRNGEKITIPGYEGKGNFIIHLDSRYKYARIRPFN